jgi:hypothetical protein
MATPAESLKLIALALSIALKFISRLNTIVCQINILAGVQALAWFCQTKVWIPFSENL